MGKAVRGAVGVGQVAVAHGVLRLKKVVSGIYLDDVADERTVVSVIKCIFFVTDAEEKKIECLQLSKLSDLIYFCK